MIAPALLTVDEAAAYLNCSPRHIERLLARGLLPSVRLGRLRRISRVALDDYWRQLEETR
jgi:excisionase family DNA binding protein